VTIQHEPYLNIHHNWTHHEAYAHHHESHPYISVL
jgi:hypothetical protein